MSISATVTLSMSMDLGPLVDAVARQGKAAAGEPPLKEEQLQAVRQAVVQDVAAEVKRGSEATKARLRSSLTKGVKLLDVTSQQDGLVVTSHTRLAIDDLALLPQIAFAAEDGSAALHPFAGFKVATQGGTTKVEGRSPKLPKAPGARGEMVLVLETKDAPASHNASSAAGGRLEWRGPLDGAEFPVKVTFQS